MSDQERAVKDVQEDARRKSDAFEEKMQKKLVRVNSEIESEKKYRQEDSFSLIELSSTLKKQSKNFTQEMECFRNDMEVFSDTLEEESNFKKAIEGLKEKLMIIGQKYLWTLHSEVKRLRGELSTSAKQYVQTRSTDTVTRGICQKKMMPISKVFGISKDDAFCLKSATSSEIPEAPLPSIGERPERY